MHRLFHGNFDFEYQLRGGVKLPPAVVRRRNTELSLLWVVLADSDDWLEISADIESGFFDHLAESGFPLPHRMTGGEPIPAAVTLCPWGWTADVIALANRCPVAIDTPPLDIVRTVNSRRFSLALEIEWDVGLIGAARIESETDLHAALEQLPAEASPWLLKADFGMAGRERIRGTGRELSEAALQWLRKRLPHDEAVIFEPCVNIVAEAGLQMTIPKSGPPVLEGITLLLADTTGTYRGSRFDEAPSIQTDWSDAVLVALRAAERIQSLGYFGPLGIDAAKYTADDDTVHLRPLQDINARFTMGRLSLGLRRLLQPGETGEWRHQHWPTDSPDAAAKWFQRFRETLPKSSRVIRTSPFHLAGHPVAHGTAVVISAE